MRELGKSWTIVPHFNDNHRAPFDSSGANGDVSLVSCGLEGVDGHVQDRSLKLHFAAFCDEGSSLNVDHQATMLKDPSGMTRHPAEH
jgi:hypothetical protein